MPGVVFKLSVLDFIHESKMSICLILALAAVLSPLLILFGLKFGMVDTLTNKLMTNPGNRHLINVGAGQFNDVFLDQLKARDEVDFVIPSVRPLAADFYDLKNTHTGTSLQGVALYPTEPGDPLVPDGSGRLNESLDVFASEGLARKLDLKVGSTLVGMVVRRINGQEETVEISLRVADLLPPNHLNADSLLVSLSLLERIEDYRDGYKVEGVSTTGKDPRSSPRVYAKFRLYAKDIFQVEALIDHLQDQGIETHSEVEQIRDLRILDSTLGQIFWIIAVIGAGGFLASLAANLLSNVERKKRDLAIIRQLGVSPRGAVLFPIYQSLLVGVGGSVLALMMFEGVSWLLNAAFADSLSTDEFICLLRPDHMSMALAFTLGVSLIAALWAGVDAARLDPAEAIRER
ncbi:ABC transporter permease [Magnetospira sp. QH-2]|uniref:ABC transporter permease n=1 Tax=Magnetospira sp. (strain QH-2) TaxID=1288970 RepID=UPI0003E8165A|nr:FtsX-like permease family protein [Magnetospira sp. QH-2]CCQ73204.1 Conserved membrane protein of unknown function [Magnetospira sp. QH-2]